MYNNFEYNVVYCVKISIFSFCGHFVWQSRTVCAILVEGINYE